MVAGRGGRRSVRRWLTLVASVLTALCLFPVVFSAPAGAATLPDCLAQRHVCATSSGDRLISAAQQAQLQRQIGGDDIYLVIAASGSSGYNAAMDNLIGALNGHAQFTVGFLDSRLKHFGAYSKEMLPSGAAGDIATRVVADHRADQNEFAALTDFVS